MKALTPRVAKLKVAIGFLDTRLRRMPWWSWTLILGCAVWAGVSLVKRATPLLFLLAAVVGYVCIISGLIGLSLSSAHAPDPSDRTRKILVAAIIEGTFCLLSFRLFEFVSAQYKLGLTSLSTLAWIDIVPLFFLLLPLSPIGIGKLHGTMLGLLRFVLFALAGLTFLGLASPAMLEAPTGTIFYAIRINPVSLWGALLRFGIQDIGLLWHLQTGGITGGTIPPIIAGLALLFFAGREVVTTAMLATAGLWEQVKVSALESRSRRLASSLDERSGKSQIAQWVPMVVSVVSLILVLTNFFADSSVIYQSADLRTRRADRYGIQMNVPLGWQFGIPENGDGILAYDPGDPRIWISGSGGHSVAVEPGKTYGNIGAEEYAEKLGYQHSERYYLHVVVDKDLGDGQTHEEIVARSAFIVTTRTGFEIHTYVGDIDYVFSVSAPWYKYWRYRRAFYRLAEDFCIRYDAWELGEELVTQPTEETTNRIRLQDTADDTKDDSVVIRGDISGYWPPVRELYIGGKRSPVQLDGSFAASSPLLPGKNTIRCIIYDTLGTMGERDIVVRRR